MNEYDYQHGFSKAHAEEMYDQSGRELKARKMIAVLEDYFNGPLTQFRLLDVGCSTGIIAHAISHVFGRVTGIDIDEEAIAFARKSFQRDNLAYQTGDSMRIPFEAESFDVVVCAQVYEHVPDAEQLMREIHRVLKPGGVCFFAAGNRFVFMEAHYRLPMLAAIPKWSAHLYLRLMRKGHYYYENHRSLWGLRRLVRDFNVVDYTVRIIRDPVKFKATDMIQAGSFKQKMALAVLKTAYWLCPTYIWVLEKEDCSSVSEPSSPRAIRSNQKLGSKE